MTGSALYAECILFAPFNTHSNSERRMMVSESSLSESQSLINTRNLMIQ